VLRVGSISWLTPYGSTSQRAAEELPVRAGERRSAVAARNELLSLLNQVGEVRPRDIELAHAWHVVAVRQATGGANLSPHDLARLE
jgi:hypothetical protein